MWREHRATEFPAGGRERSVEGVDLAAVDAEVTECVASYLERHALDAAACRRLSRCVEQLDRVLPTLRGDTLEYFRRTEAMAGMLLHHCQADG
jgi:hypothetical protein